MFITFCTNSCYVKPVFHFKASFEPSMVDDVEVFIRDVSKEWNLRLFEKGRGSMKILSNGQEAFFIALYFEGDAILTITNTGPGKVLSLMALDFGDLPLEKLEQLTDEIRSGLKSQFNIELEAVGT